MTSKIVVNNIEADAGVSTVFFNSDIGATDGTLNVDGNLTVDGVITYEDVTNVDSVGIVTARSGLHITGGGFILNQQRSDTHASLIIDKPDAGTGTLKFFNNGSASAYIQHTNAERLDYYLPSGSGSQVFYTNATERLRIDSSGNVNFGAEKTVSFPSGTGIQVYNSSAPRIKLVNDTTGNAAGDGLQIYVSGSSAIFDQKENAEMRFYTNATERLRITSTGKCEVYKGTSTTGKTSGSEAFTVGNGAGNKRFSVYPDGSTVIGGQGIIGNYNILLQNDGTIITTSGMQAASVNLQSSSTNSWFQTGANYGGTNYVWAAKDSSANVWHSGLQTDGDLLLGGNITGTSYIQLNGSTGNATFIGKVDIGNQYTGGEILKLGKSSGTSYTGYYNGGTAHGFIGHADQLVASGSATDFAIRATNNLVFATNGNNERLRITSAGNIEVKGTRAGSLQANDGDTLKLYTKSTSADIDRGTGITFYTHDGSGYEMGGTIQVAKENGGVNNPASYMRFSTQSGSTTTERLRIKSGGAVSIYQNSSSSTTEGIFSCRGRQGRQGMNASSYGNVFNWYWTGGAAIQAWVDTTHVGNVSYTSDYRIKRNIQNQPDTGIDRVKQLRPVTYNGANFTIGEMETQISVEDNILHEGFVAHEIGEVIPDGCVGEKDSDTEIQSLNLSAIISVVTKGLQEAITKIETLEARITALEGS